MFQRTDSKFQDKLNRNKFRSSPTPNSNFSTLIPHKFNKALNLSEGVITVESDKSATKIESKLTEFTLMRNFDFSLRNDEFGKYKETLIILMHFGISDNKFAMLFQKLKNIVKDTF